MPSIYELKPRFQALLRPLAGFLAKSGATANQVTVSALVLSFLAGLMIRDGDFEGQSGDLWQQSVANDILAHDTALCDTAQLGILDKALRIDVLYKQLHRLEDDCPPQDAQRKGRQG